MVSADDLVHEYLAGEGESQSSIVWSRGLIIDPQAARSILTGVEIEQELRSHYQAANPEEPNDLMIRSFAVGKMLKAAELLPEFVEAVEGKLENAGFDNSSLLLIRQSSASPFDNPLRVSGLDRVAPSLKKLYQEHFSNGLIRRFENPDYDPFEHLPTLVVQESPAAERSGLVLTYEPKSTACEFVAVYSTWGLAEDILRRTVARDEYWFHKHALTGSEKRPLYSYAGSKEFLLYYDPQTHRLEHLDLSHEKGRGFSLTESEALELALLAQQKQVEAGQPVELAWAYDQSGLQVMSCRPLPWPSPPALRFFSRQEEGRVLTTGRSASHSVATGRIRVIRERSDLELFQPGEVLVARKTEPDWEPYFKKASAIVTELDRRVSHSTILAREMGIPALLEADDLFRLENGQRVTVSCCEGETGYLYAGEVKHGVEEFSLSRMPSVKAQLMVNLSLPERALSIAQFPWSGAGLVRSEFMIGSWVKIHPRALLYPDRLSRETRAAIDRLTRGQGSGSDYFITKMAQALGLIAGAFWPRPVTVRFSDFKSNEYARLLGGEEFEPKESQPMLGWRGAGRYLHPEFEEAFELELQAVRRVREDFGFTNVRVMIPFCRTPEEGSELVELIRANRDPSRYPLEIWGMAELPSNVIMADEFVDIFDGLSIGSSDLTSLTLGVARDSEYIADYFDELHPVMMKAYQTLIEASHRAGKPISFCGQIASTDSEFAALLVEMGVDILSLAPDALHAVLRRLGAGSEQQS